MCVLTNTISTLTPLPPRLLQEAWDMCRTRVPCYVPSKMLEKQLRIDDCMHNRLIMDARTCLNTRLSKGARRLRKVMSKTTNWSVTEGERSYVDKLMHMHNSFVESSHPGVDTAPPQHALDMMAKRHARPNLGDGPWLVRQSAKVGAAFAGRVDVSALSVT